MRSIMHPSSPFVIRGLGVPLTALVFDQWFSSLVPVMKPEEMFEFCEHLTVFMVDAVRSVSLTSKRFFSIFFGMLRSPGWRNHIVTRL